MSDKKHLQKAVDYIELRLKDPLAMGEMAKGAAMSAFHFQRLFSNAFDCTVSEYIRGRRLSLAAAEVVGTNHNP